MDTEIFPALYDRTVDRIDGILRERDETSSILSSEATIALDDALLKLRLWKVDVCGEGGIPKNLNNVSEKTMKFLQAVFEQFNEEVDQLISDTKSGTTSIQEHALSVTNKYFGELFEQLDDLGDYLRSQGKQERDEVSSNAVTNTINLFHAERDDRPSVGEQDSSAELSSQPKLKQASELQARQGKPFRADGEDHPSLDEEISITELVSQLGWGQNPKSQARQRGGGISSSVDRTLKSSWSEWIWSTVHQKYYKERLNAAGEAEYEFAPPLTQLVPSLFTQPASYGSSNSSHPLSSPLQNYVAGSTTSRIGEVISQDNTPRHFHPAYQKVTASSERNFFVEGRVFSVLWSEPARQMASTKNSSFTRTSYDNENTFIEIRRFILVKPFEHHSLCVPICSYSGKGAAGRQDAHHHSIVFTDNDPPRPLDGEGLVKYSIRVVPSGNEPLKTTSRVNFSKTYTVEHNVKVKKIGKVFPDHLSYVMNYWKEAMGTP